MTDPPTEKGQTVEGGPFGVLCRLADDEQILVTVDATDARDAQRQVHDHQRLFYGPGDGAGRWLASKNPTTIVSVGEARPMDEWDRP